MKPIERRKLQKEFYANKSKAEGGAKPAERRKIQKRQFEIIALLGLGKKVGKAASRLADLIAGKFDSKKPVSFIELVRDMIRKGEAQLDDIRQPVINYHDKHLM